MRYVIKYVDGAFNRGRGFTCTLEEATVYGSEYEAQQVADDLCDVECVMPFELAALAEKEAVISFPQLADAIEAATIEIEVCSPSNDYYSRPQDWDKRTISIIDPHMLLSALRGKE